MGNSGGTFFECACNLHPLVACWEEQHKRLNLPNSQDWKKRDKVMIRFLRRQMQLNKERKILKTFERVNQQTVVTKKRNVQSLGFIKSFGPDMVDFVLGEGSGRVVQLCRHPIKVVAWKMGKKKPEARHALGRSLKTQRDVFEGHVKFYAQRYRIYLDRAGEYRLIRLEDIGASLIGDARYFIDTFEYMTGVEWTAEHIRRVRRKAKPRHRKNWKYPRRFQEDNLHHKIWKHRWQGWQKKIFLKYFEQIMKEADYDWPGR